MISEAIIDSLTSLSTNGRRALEVYKFKDNIFLSQPRWHWTPTKKYPKVDELREAFNRIIHSKELSIGYEELPSTATKCENGAFVALYALVRTDRKELSYVDLFSVAHAWLRGALAEIEKKKLE